MAQGARELQQVRPNRIPPHNLDAEQSVLGAMLESKEAIANVVEILNPDDFYKPAHSEIYEAIHGALQPRTRRSTRSPSSKSSAGAAPLEGIGGRPYILGLLEAYPTASSAARYARIVEELALLRRLIERGQRGAGDRLLDARGRRGRRRHGRGASSTRSETGACAMSFTSSRHCSARTWSRSSSSTSAASTSPAYRQRLPRSRRHDRRLPAQQPDHHRGAARDG